MPTVLVTGFEPFGGDAMNPSSLAARALDGRMIERHRVVGVELPCVFGDSLETLRREIRRSDPVLVLCVGQDGGSEGLSVERVAINIDDARIADNAGEQPMDRPIVKRGPVAYWSTLPVKAIVSAWHDANISGNVSHSAGTFVCNHVFYGLMHMLTRRSRTRGGFVHVPWIPEQAARVGASAPCMPLEKTIAGLEIAIATSLQQSLRLRRNA